MPGQDSGGPSWLTFLGHMRDRLWSMELFRCESAMLRTHWVLVVMRSPNLNSYAERWVRSVNEECLAKLILFWRVFGAASVAAIFAALP